MIKLCRHCKHDFEPTKAQEKYYKWVCPSCRSGNGQEVVSLYVRACRRCNNNFFPSPSQIRNHQWICIGCRWWGRKSRAKTIKGLRRFIDNRRPGEVVTEKIPRSTSFYMCGPDGLLEIVGKA